jgi:restriction system protein
VSHSSSENPPVFNSSANCTIFQLVGDDRIDGIIKEDKLGLDAIYLQAKRWEETVGGPVVQGFAGALIGKKARKGVFITTSNFSPQAKSFASGTENLKIVLIDGEQLAKLMIDCPGDL